MTNAQNFVKSPDFVILAYMMVHLKTCTAPVEGYQVMLARLFALIEMWMD